MSVLTSIFSLYNTHSLFNNYMLRTKARHFFNDISFTSWPFFTGCTLWILLFYTVLSVRKFAFATPFLLLWTLYLLILFIFDWFDDMIFESRFNGRYNRKLRASLVCGFILFLVSEIMLFGGFFWAYFDRVFNPSTMTGGICIPTCMEHIDSWRWPFVGTIVLLTSGYFANQSYYLLKAGSYAHCITFGFFTIILAVLFLVIQLVEYNGLSLTISDNVYSSFFYLLTGFHGFHVTVGLLFLCEQYSRIAMPLFTHRIFYLHRINYMSNRDRHLGLAFAVIYWHFVDIIWIFLFFNVYVANTTTFMEWISATYEEVYYYEMHLFHNYPNWAEVLATDEENWYFSSTKIPKIHWILEFCWYCFCPLKNYPSN